MSNINTANLRILADFLKANFNLVEDHLAMRDFCNYASTPTQFFRRLEAGQFRIPTAGSDCNTTMCLAGWAATIPELMNQSSTVGSYSDFVDDVFSESGSVFDYLFASDWEDSLQHGIDRIERLVLAVEQDDTEFLAYLEEYAGMLVELHSEKDEDNWEYIIDQRLSSSAMDAVLQYDTILDAFPILEVPDWFKESA
jgi:hypothetical protein